MKLLSFINLFFIVYVYSIELNTSSDYEIEFILCLIIPTTSFHMGDLNCSVFDIFSKNNILATKHLLEEKSLKSTHLLYEIKREKTVTQFR